MINYIEDLYKAIYFSCKNFKVIMKDIRDIRKMSQNILTEYTLSSHEDDKEIQNIKNIRTQASCNFNPEKSKELIKECYKQNDKL